MTRYIIQFADKTTKRVPQREAEAIIKALSEKKPVIFRGAFFAAHHIVAVKPITKEWFDGDTVELETRSSKGLLR